jgi:hypothetical protein
MVPRRGSFTGEGDLTSVAALTKNVPAPVNKEFSGGPGMHIHDKLVVVDFNAAGTRKKPPR